MEHKLGDCFYVETHTEAPTLGLYFRTYYLKNSNGEVVDKISIAYHSPSLNSSESFHNEREFERVDNWLKEHGVCVEGGFR